MPGLSFFIRILVAGTLLSGNAFAAEEATFGSEFTFSNAVVRLAPKGGELSLGYQMSLIEAILENCEGCQLDVTMKAVTFPDGFKIDVLPDPGVIEVNTTPLTSEYLRDNRQRIEGIFAAAKAVGLFPGVTIGGGHVHIGVESGFDNNAILFRNFFVDTFNHIELGTGILAEPNANSPHIVELGTKSEDAFRRIIAEFDKHPTTIEELAKKIKNQVYFTTTVFNAPTDPPDKYQALNVTRITKDAFGAKNKTLELRFIRPQASADSFEKIVDLFESRLLYLKRKGGLVPLENPAMSLLSEEKFQRFVSYLQEMGKDWVNYSGLLSPKYYQHAWTLLGNWNNVQTVAFVRTQLDNMHMEDEHRFAEFISSKLQASPLAAVTEQEYLVLREMMTRGGFDKKTAGAILKQENWAKSPWGEKILSELPTLLSPLGRTGNARCPSAFQQFFQ